MCTLILLSIFVHLKSSVTSGAYLDGELSYIKPKLEHNSKVNKAVWFRGNDKTGYNKISTGNFIFRDNSLEENTVNQNAFDPFVGNYLQDIPIVTSYIERSKRSNHKRKRSRKSVINCNGKLDCITKNKNEKFFATKLNRLRNSQASSLFKEHPYEASVDDKNYIKTEYNNNENNSNLTVIPLNGDEKTEAVIKNIQLPIETKIDKKEYVNDSITSQTNYTKYNSSLPKRSMKNDYESFVIKKLEFIEDLNGTNVHEGNKVRSVYDKDKVWLQTAPLPQSNVYKVVPKMYATKKSKPVNERGLIKVLAMLTKSFKKIMQQHEDIKVMYDKINVIYDDVVKNIQPMTKKVQEFEVKYTFLLKTIERVKKLEDGLTIKAKNFDQKEKELTKSLIEFENQQKQFLAQQRQFYNIQKLMLAQNEKINVKQNLIAKTQSEISHRQNDFAKVLKKAKQLYAESKIHVTKANSSLKTNVNLKTNTITPLTATHTTTRLPKNTEPIKINLFTLPTKSVLRYQDDLILKERDEQPVDEIIYKYYFNNTYIDNLMKSKILSTFSNRQINAGTQNSKNKRNEEIQSKITILLPVYNNDNSKNNTSHNIEKRWIHHYKTKSHKKNRGKENVAVNEINDRKTANMKQVTNSNELRFDIIMNKTSKIDDKSKVNSKVIGNAMKNDSNPFYTMAWNFCKEIRQNANTQILNWCVEKALRKLQNIDVNVPAANTLGDDTKISSRKLEDFDTTGKSHAAVDHNTTDSPVKTTLPIETTDIVLTSLVPTTLMETNGFFPDNEELESNLRKYDLTPDTEGNVYYEGSLHESDVIANAYQHITTSDEDDEGISDIMPGMDDNYRVGSDLLKHDIQAKRRAAIRRLNTSWLRRISKRQP